jgi:hypothetical protein
MRETRYQRNAPQHGCTLREAACEQSRAAVSRGANYGGFYGHGTKDVMQELNVRDAQQQQQQQQQSFLANQG